MQKGRMYFCNELSSTNSLSSTGPSTNSFLIHFSFIYATSLPLLIIDFLSYSPSLTHRAQIDSGEINGSISADGTVTFADPVPQFSKDDLDRLLVEAQQTSRELLEVERHLNASKEYLTKVPSPPFPSRRGLG